MKTDRKWRRIKKNDGPISDSISWRQGPKIQEACSAYFRGFLAGRELVGRRVLFYKVRNGGKMLAKRNSKRIPNDKKGAR